MTDIKKLIQATKKEWQGTLSYFSERSKVLSNYIARKRGKPEPYSVSSIWRRRGPKPFVAKIERRLREKYFALPPTVRAATIALLAILVVLLVFGADFDWSGVTTELWGLVAEVFILGIIIFYIGERNQANQFVKQQHELIEDLKYWDNDEAKFRILGALRRLQRVGVSNVNLAGVTLSSAKLKEHGIDNLDGSTLSGGNWASSIGVRVASKFEKVDFSDCSMCEAKLSQGDGMGAFFGKEHQRAQAIYVDCSFLNSDLSGVCFEQAEIKYTQKPPEETHEHVDDDEYGNPVFAQRHYGEFNQADLQGASFRNSWLENVDFRNANFVESADFAGARGLETCEFDSAELKQKIIRKSKEKPL
ncbi:pentapeptide repeat-containing protein [Falsihalocynthiibacter sp. SS001]|uniref:pentapeptide repeat-containing protein n=1 Tax=Falsihalocynthiibacter sp. SS001 TaxID=3349698 RepID=UPI0036D3C183